MGCMECVVIVTSNLLMAAITGDGRLGSPVLSFGACDGTDLRSEVMKD